MLKQFVFLLNNKSLDVMRVSLKYIDIFVVLAYLQDGEVLEHAVHHVFFRQMLQLVDEVDHVLTHGRARDAVHEAAILEPRVLFLYLLHHLLAKGTNFGGARDRHVLVTLVPAR